MHVKINEEQSGRRAKITPTGFWSEAVTINQSHAYLSDDWTDPIISWSTGGYEIDSIDASQSLIEALVLAQKICSLWKENRSALEYVEPKEG